MTFKDVEKVLKDAGCEFMYVRGSHYYFHSPITGIKFPVPRHGNHDLKKGTVNKIKKQAGLK